MQAQITLDHQLLARCDGRAHVPLHGINNSPGQATRWAHLPYEFLDHVSRRIINETAGISRVVYDISGKPPATIEWE